MTDAQSGADHRIPPHNLSAEESLLGAMMLNPTATAEAMQMVRASDFYRPAHAHIFEAISAIYATGGGIDPVTVAEALSKAGLLEAIGGASVLLSIQSATPAVANAAHYARIVEEHALMRRLVNTATEIAELGYAPTDDVIKTLDVAESMIYEVAERRVTDSMKPLKDLLSDSLDYLEMLYDRKDAITGTPSGYHKLDELLSGFQKNALIVVGARPAMGKTSFAMGAAAHAALRENLPVLFFSLEMGHLELTQRLLGSEGRIDATRLKNGQLTEQDWRKVTSAMNSLSEAPLWLDDNPQLTIMEIRAKARRLKSRVGNLGLIVVDYLQLMQGRGNTESRQLEIAEMSRGLKMLARELECPVMALSQLSRGLELRQDKRPMLADLRESGAIEQDADVVLFLYRDEVYNPESADKGTAEVIVAKHRSGPTGSTRLAFLDHCTLFANMANTDD